MLTTSSQPRKQRYALYNAPMHLRHSLLSATLAKPLRKEYGRRALPLRKGDTVTVMRGNFAGVSGVVTNVDLKALRVTVDGVKRKKTNGTEVAVLLHPSNLRLTKVVVDDKRRAKIIERSGGKVTVVQKKAEKEDKKEKKTEGFKCPMCSETFTDKTTMDHHIGEKHKEYR